MVASRVSSPRLKATRMIIPNTATASRPPTRDTALLIPDATPTNPGCTDPITAVVSGATVIAMPSPITTITGKKVVQ